MSFSRTDKTYDAWRNMKHRATKADKTMDPRWLYFECFLADMGSKPIGARLVTVERDAGYCKENCYWRLSAV